MDEQNNAALPVEPAAETKKKRRPIRHMIWAVCLIALLIALLGQIVGDFLVGFAIKGFGITDASTLFLFMYLSMIGVDLLVLLYTLLCERPIFRSFGRRAVPGGRGNTWKLFGVGLLAGFAMNALCILAAWLHGDIVLSVGRFRPLYLLAALVCV